MSTLTSDSRRRAGSTTVLALLTLLVLSFTGAFVLRTVSMRYDYSSKANGWAEALSAAEAGADYGLANCRWSVTDPAKAFNQTNVPRNVWKKQAVLGGTWQPVASWGEANTELILGRKLVFEATADTHLTGTGQGATDTWFQIEVDAPATLVVAGKRWFRIRSTGYATLPGLARSHADDPDAGTPAHKLLRKLDLKFDHFAARYGGYPHAGPTNVALSRPQAARRIEVLVKPAPPSDPGIVAADTNGNPLQFGTIDSFDSSDTVNYPLGLYDSGPRDAFGNEPVDGVGRRAKVYINAPLAQYNGTIYGSLGTNNGTIHQSNGGKKSNITGAIVNDRPQAIPPVTIPSWAGVASGTASTVTAGTTASPFYGSYTSADKLHFKLPAGATSGVAKIYVTGNVTGGITVDPGVRVQIYFAGNFDSRSNMILNKNLKADYLRIHGINPSAGQTRTVEVGPGGGPSDNYAVWYAPGHDLDAGGSPTHYHGGLVFRTFRDSGQKFIHYDEALAHLGEITDYQRASWVEDER